MCLGIPGRILEVSGDDPLYRMAKVSFGGAVKEVSLATVPDAEVGAYVVVHAGMAISTLNEDEAQEVLSYLDQLE